MKELGRGRVTLSFRLTTNQGPAHTFNTCIQRSYGHWIHILHGDDVIIRGFYEASSEQVRFYPRRERCWDSRSRSMKLTDGWGFTA